MIQNIKVDVIYFSTPTDFEMEFNLCGCCRMRLLTDKADTRKELIRALSRAVSRSRVIICCGPLFSEEGLISNVAAAIDKKLVKADNKGFGIATEKEIDIIDGSLPLVTTDGTFGGCVIESGPQSIIMLSDNKSVRKTLLSSLIHPYIEELSRLPENAAVDTPTAKAGAHNKSAAQSDTAYKIKYGEDVDTEVAVLEELMSDELEEFVSLEELSEQENIDPVEEPTEPQKEEEAPFIEQLTKAEETEEDTEDVAETQEDTEDAAETEESPETDTQADTDYVPLPDNSIDLFDITAQDDDDDEDDVQAPPISDDYLLESEERFTPPFKWPLLILAIIVLLCVGVLAVLLIINPLSKGVSVIENFNDIFTLAAVSFGRF